MRQSMVFLTVIPFFHSGRTKTTKNRGLPAVFWACKQPTEGENAVDSVTSPPPRQMSGLMVNSFLSCNISSCKSCLRWL